MNVPEKSKINIGLFGFLAITGAFIIFGWLLTFQIPELLYPLVTIMFFIVGGLVLALMMGVRLRPFTMVGFIDTVLLTGLNIVLIFYVNQLLPLRFDYAVVDPQLFGVLVGVGEECLRIGLLALCWRLTRNVFITLFVPSLVWVTLHIPRYGSTPQILFIILIVGVILNASILYTGNADGSIFGHAGVNYIVLG